MNHHVVAHWDMSFFIDERALFSEVIVQFGCDSLDVKELFLFVGFFFSHNTGLEVSLEMALF